MTTSHVKCRGGYAGCLGTAHRGAVLDLCKVCRVARQNELELEGKSIHGKTRAKESLLRALDDTVGPRPQSTVQGELHRARAHMLSEAYQADAETGGHGVVDPVDRFRFAQDLAVEHGLKYAAGYTEFFRGAGPGVMLCPDAELVPYNDRVEIREAFRTLNAPREELATAYALTLDALDRILAEPDAPEPEKEEPQKMPTGKTDSDHMAHMRQVRSEKARLRREAKEREETQAAAQLAFDQEELARLRAQVNGHAPVPSGTAWKVTVRRTETVYAPTLTDAVAQLELHDGEALLGIVQA